jgi:hypothetical protein
MLAAVVVLGACGADGSSETAPPAETVSAQTYVTDLCGSITTWRDNIGALTEELQSHTDDPASLDVVKDTTVAFFDDAITATDALLADVEAAGVPDVADGGETARRVTTAIDDIRDAIAEGRDRVDGLSIEDPQAFASELRTISDDVGADLQDVTSELASFEAPELDEAAEDVPACEGF